MATPVSDVHDLTDADLVSAGFSLDGPVQFESAETHIARPGERLVEYGDGRENRLIGRMTPGSSDMSQVAIYDITGRRITTTKDWALKRLKKTHPAEHPNPAWRGQPVFYTRPPVDFPAPTFPCPLVASGLCRKMLHSADLRDAHFRTKHAQSFEAAERSKKADREERSIQAQERTAALLERLITGGADVAKVTADDLSELVAEATADEPDFDAAAAGEIPNETWKRQRLIAWLKENEHPVPEDWIKLSTEQVWAHVKGLME